MLFSHYILLGKPEIDEVKPLRGLLLSHAEIVRFDVSMDDLSRVNVLYSLYHLINKQENSFE